MIPPRHAAQSPPVISRASLALLCAGLILLPHPARADNTADEADVAFSLGNQAYGKREYDKALSWYFLSHRLVPNRNVLFNIARCFEALGKFDEAFRYYFELSSEKLADDDTREVKAALARLTSKVALLSVSSDPPGADVYVDREDLGSRGPSPLTLALPPGAHTVFLKHPGHRSADGKATTAKGRDTKLKLKLERILGVVELTGTPEGASVRETLDGPALAQLPAKLSFVPGQRLLVITADGYTPQQLLVDVKPDAVESLKAALAPLPRPKGKVIVTANRENALVRVDGREAGFTPTVLSLDEGEYTIEVSAKDLTASSTKVKVGKDTEDRISAELRYLPPAVRAASKSLSSVDDAPASVTVITREELQSFGYQTLAEAVQAVRGLFITNDRIYTYLGIRGFSPPGDFNTRIAILWDGHVMNDVWVGQGFSARDLDVDLSEIDRIEVVRGPGSALYGTGALFAVINCVPRDTLGDRNVEGTVAAGGVGGVSARATGGVQGSAGSVLLSAAGFTATGAQTTDFGDKGVVNGLDGERSIGATLRAKSGGFTLSAKWNQRRKEIPNSALSSTFGIPGTKYVDARGFTELRYEREFSRVAVGARASYDASRFRGVYAIAETGAPLRYDTDIGGADWLGLELRARIRLFGPTVLGENHLSVGFEGQLAQIFQNSSNELDMAAPIDVHQRVLLSGYLLDEWRLHPRFFITGGVRVDKYLDLDGAAVSPRLGLVGKPYATGVSKFVVGQAFRAPNVYELYFTDNLRSTRAAGTLNPETILTFELEHNHDLTQELRITVSGFYNLINQLIVTTTEVGQLGCGPAGMKIECDRYSNSGQQVSALGAEGQVRWQPGRFTLVEATYSFVTLKDPNTAPEPDLQLHLASLRAMVPLYEGAVRLSTQLTYQSPRKRGVGQSLLLNVGLAGEYGFLRYFAGVQNLLDTTVALPVSTEAGDSLVPQYGRTFLIQLSAGF